MKFGRTFRSMHESFSSWIEQSGNRSLILAVNRITFFHCLCPSLIMSHFRSRGAWCSVVEVVITPNCEPISDWPSIAWSFWRRKKVSHSSLQIPCSASWMHIRDGIRTEHCMHSPSLESISLRHPCSLTLPSTNCHKSSAHHCLQLFLVHVILYE